ncbi:MAG: type II toxin-antitoxin system VapB family antitoxin [Bifidobacteriaceae bacterium]|jgi:Arc/MetJ family transcription regulator|nr:type II toxin-antitoxin system VapB family antitoxin [Bifidobacteriaceae bacterium]
MRTTVTLDDDLVEKAKRYTGIKETSQLLKRGLTELVRVEAGRRLIAMGGTMPDLAVAPRRKASATSGASA